VVVPDANGEEKQRTTRTASWHEEVKGRETGTEKKKTGGDSLTIKKIWLISEKHEDFEQRKAQAEGMMESGEPFQNRRKRSML